ncbi:hypothetical protein CVT25_011564 [Psilocybe cyanescens]|uniref:Uncharacterized protein n=1 Tax=Psilocybe cyanescens TaxID=93625 RepID=A0A409X0M5_PSICY|nr:hypothetical protein CVT25_011564 [Psilocybe cyanescens]
MSINGERAEQRATRVEHFRAQSDNLIEFGIDIVSENKVTARVVCVFTEQDAQVTARAEQQHQCQ